MNTSTRQKHIAALVLFSAFIVAVYVTENAFESVSRAAEKVRAQQVALASAAGGGLSANPQCIPAGPSTMCGTCPPGQQCPGKDGCPCKESASGSPGLCIGGLCKGTGQAGQTAAEAAKNPSMEGFGDILKSAFGALSSLLGKGGGGSGGGAGATPTPQELANTEAYNPYSFLDENTLTDTIDGLDDVNLVFEDDVDDSILNDTNNNEEVVDTVAEELAAQEPADPSDAITTRYERIDTDGDGIPDTTVAVEVDPDLPDFENADTGAFGSELENAGLDDPGAVFGVELLGNGDALTEDELELLALEALARQQTNDSASPESLGLPYGQLTPEEVRRLQTLGYSTVSGELNPFSGAGNNAAQAPVEEEGQGIIAAVVNFFARIFGFGAPQQ